MDTTVILAQPSGSRLRAAVVYVACVGLDSGSRRAGFGRAGALLCRQFSGTFDPPKSIVSFQDFDAKNGPMARPDLVTFSASGVHPVYAYYCHPQHGEGYNPLWYDHSWGVPPPYSQAGLCCDFSSKCVPEPPSEPGYPRDSTRVETRAENSQSSYRKAVLRKWK